MDLNYLKKLLRIFEDSSSSELSIKEEGLEIRISRPGSTPDLSAMLQLQAALAQPGMHTSAAQTQPPVNTQTPAITESAATAEATYHVINSPMVGTFYRAPSPESEPFVETGSRVAKGQTLCIVEAMKLMNEIESDIAGTVVKILPQNAQPVEFGQGLFHIKPD